MRTVSAAQQSLYARDSIRPILLVKLTTYSDVAAATVQATYYLSDRPVLYDYGNTGTDRQFEAMVAGVQPVTRTMNHVPGFGQGYAGALGYELRLSLVNKTYRSDDPAQRFWPILRALNLEWADLEVATVLGPESETGWYDLRSYTGDEHLVQFRGRITRIEGVSTDVIQLRAASPMPSIPWLYALDATLNDPKDFGARLPIVYGSAQRVPCVNYSVGWRTTLAQTVAIDTGAGATIAVTDSTGFPTGTFSIRIGGEELTVSSKDDAARTVTIVARAQNGTPALNHQIGEVVLEIVSEAVVVVAGHPITALQRLYCKNPYNGELFAMSGFTTTLSDPNVITGETVATARLSQAQLRAFLSAAFAANQVTAQPAYITTGSASETISAPASGLQTYSGRYSPFRTWNSSYTAPRLTWTDGTFTYSGNTVRMTYSGLAGTTVNASRYVLKVNYDTTGLSFGTVRAFIRVYNVPGYASGEEISVYLPLGQTGTITAYSSTRDGFTLSAANGAIVEFFVEAPQYGSTSNYVELASGWGLAITTTSGGTITRVVDAEVDGASMGYGLQFAADVDGYACPYVFAGVYGFESASGWTTSGCSVAVDGSTKTEGTNSLKVTVTPTVLAGCNGDAASWTGYGGTTIADDSSDKTEGSGSIKITTATPGQQAYRTFASTNVNGYLLAFDVKLVNLAAWNADSAYTNADGVRIIVSSDANNGGNWWQWRFGKLDGLTDEWTTIVFDPYSRNTYSTTGSWNSSATVSVGFASATTQAFMVDNFRLVPKTVTIQHNAITPFDATADGGTYRISVRPSSSLFVGSASLYLSDTAGSGTTPPAAYKSIGFSGADVASGAFTELSLTATDTGSPTVTAISTIGFRLTLTTSASGELMEPMTVHLDDLQARDDSLNPYSATPGALLEKPTDVLRHLVVEVCGEDAAVIDATSFGATLTNLGAAKLATDCRGLGVAFEDVALRIAYEARANLTRDEGASAATFRCLSAGTATSYAFPASVRTITEWTRFSESGRDVSELGARFLALYAFDPTLGASETAYLAGLRGDPDVSDFTGTTASALAALEAKFGRRDTQRIFLQAIQDEATAKDVAGYYVREGTRLAALWILEGVPWWQAYDLERGDVVTLTAPWASSSSKARVIEVVKSFGSEVVNLRVVEVT